MRHSVTIGYSIVFSSICIQLFKNQCFVTHIQVLSNNFKWVSRHDALYIHCSQKNREAQVIWAPQNRIS